MLNFENLIWEDHPANPLIEPPWPEWILADPTVIPPELSPDGRFHLYAHTLVSLQHYTSADGIQWDAETALFPGLRPYIHIENGVYYLYYERLTPQFEASIALRKSEDLLYWTDPVTVIRPTLEWHGTVLKRIGNPCLVKTRKEYLLYYSAGQVLLKDCAFPEPRHLGVARGPSPEGPFVSDAYPFLSPSDDAPFHNLGAGSIKVLFDEKKNKFWGFNNGIWTDDQNRSRSAILLLESKDGVNWAMVQEDPIIGPEEGWKNALVYALDVREINGQAWIYYNARDGWLFGRERIGLAIGRKP